MMIEVEIEEVWNRDKDMIEKIKTGVNTYTTTWRKK
jgi:hypothetical protein